jgi:SAM dependent carboxyl methyltransferase
MEPMRPVIDGVRRRASDDLAVSIFHTDLPTNDFDPLFSLLASPDSYLQATCNVFVYAGGRSLYERLFPESHLHIGWNAIAIYWLSRVPASIPGYIWSNRAIGAVKEAFARQSVEGWQAFLDHRRHELRPGGRLVVLGGASDEHGSSGAEELMDMANAALQGMVDGGTLRSGGYERIVIPTYNRTLKEFEAPFSAGSEGSPLEFESSSEVAPGPILARVRAVRRRPDLRCRLRGVLPGDLRALALRGTRRGPHPPGTGANCRCVPRLPAGEGRGRPRNRSMQLARRAPVHRQEVRRLKRIAEVLTPAVRALQHLSI